MKKKFDRVYQFKIVLKDIKPPIWRRIQVPETYTFWDFHVAIQDVMGWEDYHLHEFEMINPFIGEKVRIGLPHGDYDWSRETLPGWKQKISEYFSMENRLAIYTYDFGDNWEHIIKLEKIIPRKVNTEYPVCIAGERACPPEDCGGPWGYEEFLRIIRNPKHKEHKEMLKWIGDKFDPERFDLKEIKFDDPDKRKKAELKMKLS